ncbi:MAG: hypothetical protein K0U86_08500 [Planctomycetes bacterium]|nr:hypothetical protein [Planctomycetota bacterium]MCH9724929.1 hypothetical protein [Planctomycetota bacterium]MCH9776888.1 hypothetical protein [Planctomycetota bacterium]
MSTSNSNPDETGGSEVESTGGTVTQKRWPGIICKCVCAYYLLSALTLPFVNKVWLGEAPLLALIQVPKSFIKSVVQHECVLPFIHWAGWSRGSASPDYAMTQGWAMGIMVSVPAVCILILLLLVRPFPHHWRWIAAVILCAILDGIVTLWFDSSSSLKLYNAIYF